MGKSSSTHDQRFATKMSPEERHAFLVDTMLERGEGGLQQKVGEMIRVAQTGNRRKLKYHHETDSRRSRAGFPDLFIADEDYGRLIFAELKKQKGKADPEQVKWLNILAATGICEVYLWKPEHYYSGAIFAVIMNEMDDHDDIGAWEISE